MAFESVQDITKAYEAFYVIDEAQTQVFNLEDCEYCGGPTMAPNPTILVKNPVFMKPLNVLLEQAGLTKYETPPEEISWCESLDMPTCADCWIPDVK